MLKKIDARKLATDTKKSKRTIESSALYFGAIAFMASFVTGLLVFGDNARLFGGSRSIGLLATILGVVLAAIGYAVSSYRVRDTVKRTLGKQFHFLITTAALAFVYASIALLVIAGAFHVINDAFQGVLLDKYSSAAMLAVVGGLTAYIVYLAAAQMTTVKMSSALALFFVAGAFTSMQTADNPYWWRDHFSSLGAGGSSSSYAFNITLIIAGAVIVSLSDFISRDFARLRQKSDMYRRGKTQLIRIAISLMGVFLAMVGIFVYDQFPAMHNVATGGMAIVFVALVAALPLLAPFFSRAFYVMSYSFVGLILFCAWLWMGVGYLSLTVFELISAALIFGWLIIFIRHVAAANLDKPYANEPK